MPRPVPPLDPDGGRLRRWFHPSLLGAVVGLSLSAAADTNTIVEGWLARQAGVRTWSARVVQTRTLKSLAQPLTATGMVWFATPNRFRWELGQPAATIAVRDADVMLIVYPRLQRVEKYRLGADAGGGPWRDALALLEAGFPQARAALDARFRLLSLDTADGLHHLTLQPRSAAARRLMRRIEVTLATDDLALRATELEFADGSRLRNDFREATLNPPLDPGLFRPALDPAWETVEPAATRPAR